ncbi:MAG: GNAT family N-acetyltransferase [Patescibacteria group bacterium]
MSKQNNIIIRNATQQDIPSIVKVNHLSQRTENLNGLIQKRTKEEFKKLMKLCKHIVAAEKDGIIIGYTTILDESAPYLENEIFSFYPKHYSNFVFIDQVATHPDYRRMGIAKQMYEFFIKNEPKRILVDFLVEPRNPESIAFHERMGFKSIQDFIHLKNGMVAEVYEYYK